MSVSIARVEETKSVQCPLCGGRFPGREACPSGCPLGNNCRTLCCPHCRYRFVERSAFVDWLGRLFRGRRT